MRADESHAWLSVLLEAMPIELQSGGRPDPAEERRSLRELQAALGPEFRLKGTLGRGSVSTVYLAQEGEIGRLVAVKVLSPLHARDRTTRLRFAREGKAIASLTHPRVVHLYRFGRLPDETPYLVMQYVRGRTLEERMRAEGRVSIGFAKRVLVDVASALAAAHAKGIVHRDVRLANVLWDYETEHAVLSDFGTAALLATGGEDPTKLTRTGELVGDPRYISPEQLRTQELTEAADIYAFGVLGYRLLTGDGPYEAATDAEWVRAHLKAEPRDLKRTRGDLDAETADLLRRCLSKEPNYRPLATDIVRALTAPPARAGEAATSERLPGLAQLVRRRVPQIVVASAVGGFALLQGLDLLFGNESLVFVLALPLVGCFVLATSVVAWFHGAKGRQRSSALEWILVAAIVAAWLVSTAWLLRRD